MTKYIIIIIQKKYIYVHFIMHINIINVNLSILIRPYYLFELCGA